MNERIKELAAQAGMSLKPRRLRDDNAPNGYLESDNDYFRYNLEATRVFFEGGLEKFAELIVAECAKMCRDHGASAEHSYTPVKASVAQRTAEGCATLIERKFKIGEN